MSETREKTQHIDQTTIGTSTSANNLDPAPPYLLKKVYVKSNLPKTFKERRKEQSIKGQHEKMKSKQALVEHIKEAYAMTKIASIKSLLSGLAGRAKSAGGDIAQFVSKNPMATLGGGFGAASGLYHGEDIPEKIKLGLLGGGLGAGAGTGSDLMIEHLRGKLLSPEGLGFPEFAAKTLGTVMPLSLAANLPSLMKSPAVMRGLEELEKDKIRGTLKDNQEPYDSKKR